QRIGEIFVLATAKAVASHHDPAAEVLVVRIERGQRGAFLRRQQSLQDCAALRVEVGDSLRPVDGIDAGGDVRGMVDMSCGRFHGGKFCKWRVRTPPYVVTAARFQKAEGPKF